MNLAGFLFVVFIGLPIAGTLAWWGLLIVYSVAHGIGRAIEIVQPVPDRIAGTRPSE